MPIIKVLGSTVQPGEDGQTDSRTDAVRPNKKILSFPVTLWDFCWSVGRKNNFFTWKILTIIFKHLGQRSLETIEIAIFDNILNLFYQNTNNKGLPGSIQLENSKSQKVKSKKNGQENCPKIRFWSKSLIKFLGSRVLDMDRSRYWKRQYFFVRPYGIVICRQVSYSYWPVTLTLWPWTLTFVKRK